VSMRRLVGIAFVLLLAGAVSLSVLAYRKAFTPVTWVTLMTDHTGLQLNDGADVKLRGVIVGGGPSPPTGDRRRCGSRWILGRRPSFRRT
jgi:hypothetical protein